MAFGARLLGLVGAAVAVLAAIGGLDGVSALAHADAVRGWAEERGARRASWLVGLLRPLGGKASLVHTLRAAAEAAGLFRWAGLIRRDAVP
jgi:hypothetical protein